MPDYSKIAKGLTSLMKGESKASRTFKTSDGYTFRELPTGEITDGDMSWGSVKDFMRDMPHAYQVGDDLGKRKAMIEGYGRPDPENIVPEFSKFMPENDPDAAFQRALNKQNAKPKLTVVKKKGGAIKMQAGGLSALARLGKAGTKLTKAEEAALRARGMGVPGQDFADVLNPKDVMRMSEALGNAGAEGKTLNLTQADRSRVFGPNKGGTGFSGLQLTSEPHQQAGSVWGVGKPSHVTRLINANTPETIWSTFIGAPTQHMSNPVTVERMYEAHRKAKPSAELIEKMNKQINSAVNQKTGKPVFSEPIDISDPTSLSKAQTFDQRKVLAQAMTMGGEKKGEKAAQEAFRIIKEETDPLLTDAPTYAVGNRLFTIDKDTGIYRPDLNAAFPHQVTGTDLGLLFEPAPIELAARDFVAKYADRTNKAGKPQPMGHKDLTATTPRQFISEDYLTNLQKEGYKDGGNVTPSFTQRLQSAIETHMAMGGEVSDNTTPDLTDGGNVIYGGQYAHGGRAHMPVRSLKQLGGQRMAGGGVPGMIKSVVEGVKAAPKVDRLSMSYKDVTKRVPEVAEAIEKLNRGEITKAQYNDIVNLYKPVTPYNFVPKPASSEEAIGALRGDAAKSRYGMQAEYEPGTRVGLRLDIPAYTNKGVWVNSIHDEKAKRVAYGPVSSVKNAELSASQAQSKKIAMGGEKAPYAKIKGEWNPMNEEEAVAKAQEYLNHPEWRQIGFDPERHSYFYDRATMAPITNADEVIQIGPLVLGKNPKYGKIEDFEYDEGGYVDPFGAPDAPVSPQGKNMVELAGRMIKEQAAKEGAVLSTPEGRRDVALKVASHLPGLGMGGDLVSLVDWVQSLIPGLNKPASVLDTKGEGEKVAKYPLRGLIPSPTGEEFQEKFKEAGIQGENEAPVTEFIGNFLAPGAMLKAPKAVRGVEGGLNAMTAAARRPFTPATVTTEAVAPDLAKFKPRAFQDYATKQMIGEGAAVPMTTMGGRKTTQRPGQGVYLNEAGQLELNPMVGVDVPRAGNLSTNRALRGDIATAGQELNQEAMAAHRFVPMATNNIKDASSMMITGPGGRALTNAEVIELGKRLPGMIVTHSPRTGGVFVAPFSMEKGKIPTEFLDAQSAASAVLGKNAKIQFGKSDPNKDLMYMMRQDYGTEGGRGTSEGAQAVRKSLKRMDQSIPAAR